jgi:hypothetical protein
MMTDALATPPDDELVKGLVTEIMQIRANLDEISHRENKLRKAIQYFSLERDREARSVYKHPMR